MKAILLYSAFISLFFMSCIPDELVNPKDSRDEITGSWTCTENSPTYGELTYSVSIDKSPDDSTMIEIINFNGLGAFSSAMATLEGKKLNLFDQIVEGHSLQGSGIVSSNNKTINWSYNVVELKKGVKSKESVTAIFTR